MFKWIGSILVLIGLGVLASDVLGASDGGFRLTALGEWWAWLDRDSLLVLQPAVERHVSRGLWDNVVQPLLEWSLAIELIVLGLIVLGLRWMFRRWRSR